MSTDRIAITGLQMPDDFEAASYNAVNSRIWPLQQAHPIPWEEYVSAWRGIAYRFCACADYGESFTESIQVHGYNPSGIGLYRRERYLYGFFVSGLSVIESFCYGLFAIGAMLKPSVFPIEAEEDRRSIKPKKTRQKFSEAFPNDDLTKTLRRLLKKDTTYRDWKDVRNILSHRTSPQLTQYIGDQPTPPKWEIMGGVVLDQDLTTYKRSWLAATLGELLRDADSFTRRQNF